jgi:hypothetical protein
MLITISDDGYTKKPARDRYYRISFSNYDLTLNEIYNQVIDGHTLSCTFVDQYNYDFTIGKGFSKRDNFKQIPYVMVDLDNIEINELQSLLDSLTYKPNIAYTTFSHQVEDHGNRYRLLYFFDKPIINPYLYRELYYKITKDIKCEKDNSASSPYQFCHGTTSTNIAFESYINEELYDISSFSCKEKNIPRDDKTDLSFIELVESDSEFLRDLVELPYDEMLTKYEKTFQVINESDMVDIGDERYKLYPELYYCTYYKFESFIDDKGNKRRRIHKWKDGENRRRKMFALAKTLIAIKGDIDVEELVYNLMLNRKYAFNNSDGVLSAKCLFNIAKNALEAEYDPKPKEDHPKRRIDKEYCKEHNLSFQAVLGEILKEERYKEVEALYDPDLSIRKNVEIMRYYGIKISKDGLRRWLKEHSVVAVADAKYPKIENNIKDVETPTTPVKNQYGSVVPDDEILGLMDFSKSARWNHRYLKSLGYNVGLKRVCKLYNKYKQ